VAHIAIPEAWIIQVVERRRHGAQGAIDRQGGRGQIRMALQADEAHLGAREHPRVGRAMRLMAAPASLEFHRRMFEDEGPRLVGMAAKANLILRCGRAKLACQKTAMRVMTVAAGHQTFIDAMVDGFGKLGLNLKMTAVAEHRLGHGQKSAFHLGMVCRMAVNAAYVVLQVLGAQEVRMLFSEFMAAQAALAGFLAGECLEANYLGDISTRLGMRFSRSVTSLTALILHATVIEHCLPVRPVVVSLRDVVVAGSAGVSTGIQRRISGIRKELISLLGVRAFL